LSFYQTISDAIRDIEQYGYDSQSRIDLWITKIELAAKQDSTPESVVQSALSRMLQGIYGKLIDRGEIAKIHKGVSRFTIQKLSPKLRGELDRRIMASAQLIKLNRKQMIAQTIQRFSGWATSIPKGGSRAVDTMAVKANIKKSFSALPYEERRVMIDQGHKFTSELSDIIAVDGGAIAAEWNSHWRQPGYNYDPDHKKLDEKVFAIRGSWAIDKGLINKGAGYTDEIVRPAERPYCRCKYVYLYALRDLPDSMLTQKGAKALEAARIN
jgi:hypothetical protein